MQNKVIEVIGVDLGDGDTAISKLPMESDASPERLEIDGKKKQITAIGFEPDGRVAMILGESRNPYGIRGVSNSHQA